MAFQIWLTPKIFYYSVISLLYLLQFQKVTRFCWSEKEDWQLDQYAKVLSSYHFAFQPPWCYHYSAFRHYFVIQISAQFDSVIISSLFHYKFCQIQIWNCNHHIVYIRTRCFFFKKNCFLLRTFLNFLLKMKKQTKPN